MVLKPQARLFYDADHLASIFWQDLIALRDIATRDGACCGRSGAKVGRGVSVLDLSALRNAIASLEGALAVTGDSAWFGAQSPAVRDTLIAGVVQKFEFVYELSMKMLRRQLELGADSSAEVDQANFRDMLGVAGEKGLVEEVEAWFRHRRMRNISAHTYDQVKARMVCEDARALLNDASALLGALEACDG